MKFTSILFLIVSTFLSISVFAQTYSFNWQDDKSSFLSSTLFWAGTRVYEQVKPLELYDDFEDIDPSKIWSIDRNALSQNSKSADTWSDVMLYSSMATPIIGMLGDDFMGKEAKSISLMALQGIMFESGLTQLVKSFAERPRPYIYSQGQDILFKDVGKSASESFYSGHTSTSAYFSFFTAKVFADLHPNSKWKPIVWGGAAVLPAITGYLRYKAGKHFPSDVITGYLVGASFGILIPELYKNEQISLGMGGQGLQLSLNF